MRFKDKVTITTGAGVGIGRGIAERFGNEGAAVVIAEVDSANGETVAGAICKAGGEAMFVATDVSDETQVAAMTEKTIERYGRSMSCATTRRCSSFARRHALTN